MSAKRKTSRKSAPKVNARAAARAKGAAITVTDKAFAAALGRIAALEAQVAQLRGALKVAGSDVTIEAVGALILHGATIKFDAAATLQMQAARVDVTAGMAQCDVGMLKASGVIQCDTLQATSVIAASYTPGAGNVW